MFFGPPSNILSKVCYLFETTSKDENLTAARKKFQRFFVELEREISILIHFEQNF